MKISILGCDSSHSEEYARLISSIIGSDNVYLFDENLDLAMEKTSIAEAGLPTDSVDIALEKCDLALIEGRYCDSHFELAYEALSRCITTYIDKPTTESYQQAVELNELAIKNKVVLQSFSPLVKSNEFIEFSNVYKKPVSLLIGCPAICHTINDRKAKDISFYSSHATDMLANLIKSEPKDVIAKKSDSEIWVTIEYKNALQAKLFLPMHAEEFYFIQSFDQHEVTHKSVDPWGNYYENMAKFFVKEISKVKFYINQFEPSLYSMKILDEIKRQID